MELYNYYRSSASFRVRIALALKGLDYTYQPVHLARNEQFNESYAAVSAARLVPLFTGLVGFCPLYRLVGVNTCKL
jgi:maleylacetoacetate isomerase/maleylpyruvate isomerase